jgi:CBS domain containing-hemolysin-like protein
MTRLDGGNHQLDGVGLAPVSWHGDCSPRSRVTVAAMMSGHRTGMGGMVARASLALLALLALPSTAHASLLSPEAEDKLATFLALFVIFVVPVGLIVLFWMVHILPEKIAHKRHHPQFEAIRTLCLLSLVFGGLLWPFAWLWAYSKPVLHKMAYGTDKDAHTDEYPGEAAAVGLSDRLARLEEQGLAAADLNALRADLDAIEARLNTAHKAS